jgi:glyoxylase-like metal-dependent hydrolase (beta-lactamase superfamily II)
MDQVDIPEEMSVPMEDVAVGVKGLRIIFVNVFGITHRNTSWTLIDSGLPLSASRIRNWAEKTFSQPPNAIVLTHGHFDHASSAAELADHWNVPVYAHSAERPFLQGEREYPAPNFAAGGDAMSLLSPLLPRGPQKLGERLRDLSASADGASTFDELPGWQVLHTPGHTPGHVSLFRPEDRLLLPGDAFCTTKPESFFESSIAQKPELHGPPSYFTSNWDQARASVQRLAALEPLIVAPGHGQPISGSELPSALHRLVARFEEVAIPDNRKSAA